MPPQINWWEWLENGALAAMAGFAGLLGYTMRTLDAQGKPTLTRATLEMFSSGLVGFIVAMVCRALALDAYWTGAVCGLMGWMGAPASVRLLEKIARKKLGVDDTPAEGAQ